MNVRQQDQAPTRFPSRWLLAAALSGAALVSPLPSMAAEHGLYHGWIMRGQVLSLDGNKGLICIGKRDNAEIGQVLNVVRQTPVTTGGPRASGFRPEASGKVRISRIVDDHYSEVEVVSGAPAVHDTVELERK